jgi:hypothetical protein
MPAYTTTVGGKPRYCAICKKQVSTKDKKFVKHAPPGHPALLCPNSGKSVDAQPSAA